MSTILVTWDNNSSGPLVKGLYPAGLSHLNFEGSVDSEAPNGKLVGRYKGTLESLASYGLEEYTYPVKDVVKAPVKITKLAFLTRFSDEAAIAIDIASIDDPTASGAARQQAAALRRFIQKVNAATYIDVTRDDTVNGVLSLVGTFISQEEADSILSTEVGENEAFK